MLTLVPISITVKGPPFNISSQKMKVLTLVKEHCFVPIGDINIDGELVTLLLLLIVVWNLLGDGDGCQHEGRHRHGVYCAEWSTQWSNKLLIRTPLVGIGRLSNYKTLRLDTTNMHNKMQTRPHLRNIQLPR